jgi:betaine-aldehyde dehydrogenase
MEPTAASARAAAADAAATSGAPRIDVHRPADGSLIRSVEVDSPQRVAEAVARVREAQLEWEALGFRERARWLERWRDWLLANREPLADLIQEETGKVRAEAVLEVQFLEVAINYWTKHGPRFLADERPKPTQLVGRAKRLRVRYRPYPVVGLISPWNFPLILSAGDAIPALVAGAGVVIKPSELTPLEVIEVVRGWREEVGAPPVLEVVNGVAETGGALIDAVDFVGFTGSDRTGRAVMKRAAETLTPVSLELGGKDPAIVLRDADLERAANAVTFGGFMNTGQVCMSLERVYVEEPIYDEFVAKVVERVGSLRRGQDDRSYGREQGAITSPAQLEVIERHVADAREKGARVLCGGRRAPGPGAWYEPTVIADADHSMQVMREETFGPVLAIAKVADAEEAVRLANDSRYGLSASVFGGDTERAERIAERLEAGSVNVNDALINYFFLEVPMGGWKDSGVGWRHGPGGIRKYCRTESIVVPRFRQARNEVLWFPYDKGRRKLIDRVYRALNARGLRNRLGL